MTIRKREKRVATSLKHGSWEARPATFADIPEMRRLTPNWKDEAWNNIIADLSTPTWVVEHDHGAVVAIMVVDIGLNGRRCLLDYLAIDDDLCKDHHAGVGMLILTMLERSVPFNTVGMASCRIASFDTDTATLLRDSGWRCFKQTDAHWYFRIVKGGE